MEEMCAQAHTHGTCKSSLRILIWGGRDFRRSIAVGAARADSSAHDHDSVISRSETSLASYTRLLAGEQTEWCGCPNVMMGHMSVCLDHTAHSDDGFVVHGGGLASLTKFITEIDTTALEFGKPVINSRAGASSPRAV
ncbi:hypothetical protein EVAR_4759_1 [Eumeta japonica]|uniref:Uncharacterized protein n=1 Tax=Eumeta variegata TaxID=151549 RepID=A0A4C1SYV0_EUMVA|nr:hypothetical protein EVAR_4759_1 [Eumeta japonica]